MKTQIKLAVIGMQFLPDGKAVILTKPSKQNPSENGSHVINEGQLKRICLRAGVYNPTALKALIDLSNGSAQLIIDAEDVKAGETFKKADGETGTYTKDWTKYNNHEIVLGAVAKMKIVENELRTDVYARPGQSVATSSVKEEEHKDAPNV
jgi:hypothetical protein